MTGITLYGLKTCDTCRKALKALEAAGRSVTFVDVRSDPGLAARLPGWIAAVGVEQLANTRSTTWRGSMRASVPACPVMRRACWPITPPSSSAR